MSEEQKNIKPESNKSKDPMDIIIGTYIDWGKSKEQVWSELERRMDSVQPEAPRIVFSPWMKIAMAAVFTLLVGFAFFMQMYTRTVTVPAGQHSHVVLPDQSSIELNAASVISYKPLLYTFSRIVTCEGEAFFEVQKGRKFQVVSEKGKTEVLGTSFNVYSRNDEYQITCVTGKVEVTESKNNKAVILQAGQKAILNPESILYVQSILNSDHAVSWLENKLNFTSVPLRKVFDEIERQYGVQIYLPENLDSVYTGTFYTNTPVGQALDLVCKPFNLTYTLNSENEYNITRNEQKIN